MTTRLELLPDVYLTAVQTSRFKTACFSLSFLRPLRQEEAGMNALLPSVLLRGSESAPSIRAIADRWTRSAARPSGRSCEKRVRSS